MDFVRRTQFLSNHLFLGLASLSVVAWHTSAQQPEFASLFNIA